MGVHFPALAIISIVLLFVVPVVIGRRRWRVVAPIALVVTVVALGLGFFSSSENRTIEAAELTDARTVQIGYVAGDCEDYRRVSTTETDDSVTVTIRAWSFATSCSDVGTRGTATIRLDDDLGSRRLLDGACDQMSTACVREVAVDGRDEEKR